jgi:hypothetical protein
MKCYVCKKDFPETEFYENKLQCRGYNYACKKCENKMSLDYQKQNWEKVKNKHNEWMENHPEYREHVNEYNKDYRKRPEYKEQNKSYQWKYAHTERGRIVLNLKTARRRKRERDLINDITPDQVLQIKADQRNLCNICHREFTPELPYELDHIFPVEKSQPGDPGLTMGNVQLLCRSCNAVKHNKV